MLCPTVIRELDRHKVHHPQSKFRRRAQEIITRLHSRLSSPASDAIRDGVKLEFLSEDPSVDFAANRLRPEIADDWLVASVLEWKKNHASDVTAIVTADLGISIKAKNRSIAAFVPHEPDKLADELDAEEKLIKKLQGELSEMKSALPILKVCFKDGGTVARLKIQQPTPLEASMVERLAREVRAKHPLHPVPENPKEPPKTIQSLGELQRLLGKGGRPERFWPREEILRHNATVESFYTNYADYLRAMNEHRNMERRTIQFEVVLENGGSSPAEDVDIHFHFPDGFQLSDADEDGLPKAPESPEPPPRLGEFRIPDMSALMSIGSYGIQPSSHAGMTSNVSSPSIRRTNSYDVRSHVKRAKHGIQISIAKLVAVFDSYEAAKSFQIDYVILAANMPKSTTGHLSIVLEKT